MGNYYKEYLDISSDNVVCEKFIFDEKGITYQYLSEYGIKLLRGRQIIHCFCPYGSIKKIITDRESVRLTIIFRVKGNIERVDAVFCHIDHLDALADSIEFARSRIKKAARESGIIYDGKCSNTSINHNTTNINWFKYAFPMSVAFLIFWIVDDLVFWKILGAVIAFGFGFIVSKWLGKTFDKTKHKTALTAIKIFLCIFPILLAIVIGYGSKSYDNPYKDVFDKNPNKWTDDEKDYVDDFFESMGNN